eukprot:6193190-Pleurochrysis_carterae.AAC.2
MPDIQALRADCSASLITFLSVLWALPRRNLLHYWPPGGSKSSAGWTTREHAAYPPDFNFLIAKVFGTLHASSFHAQTIEPESVPTPLPPPRSERASASAAPRHTAPRHATDAALRHATDAVAAPPPPQTEEAPTPREHFRRALGDYPLRWRNASALLTFRSRKDKPVCGRGTGCAFAVNNVSTDPRTRKQAMAEDRIGWGTAERAEIANHASNGSWTTIDRLQVPTGRSLVRLIWVYKRKRSGALKARLCVQGCAQVHGIDYDQTFCATMRDTSLRALAAIASAAGMRMRRWDFVAAYLQGDLEQNEVVYCHAPPGYATVGADGRPRVCRVEKPIYGMAQAGRRWQRSLFP